MNPYPSLAASFNRSLRLSLPLLFAALPCVSIVACGSSAEESPASAPSGDDDGDDDAEQEDASKGDGARPDASTADDDGGSPGDAGADAEAPALGSVVEIGAGQAHTCARFANGAVKCWGENGDGRLGLGDTRSRGEEPGDMGSRLPTVDLGPGRTAKALAVGAFFTCALLDDGEVKCWGLNTYGSLGLGDKVDRGTMPGQMGASLAAVDLGPGQRATALSAGERHVCAILEGGSVKCWGEADYGQLGVSGAHGGFKNTMGSALPTVDLGAGRTARSISAGGSFTCAILDDATLKCWGRNNKGQLGLGDKTSRGQNGAGMGSALLAVNLGTGRTVREVRAGNVHVCARLDDDSVKCWGSNSEGELGLGDAEDRGDAAGEMGDSLPTVNLGAGRKAVALSAGGRLGLGQTCAVLDDARVKCWGYNNQGQLGLGDRSERGNSQGEMGDQLPAVDLGTNAAVKAVATNGAHSCALLASSSVKCWGGWGGLGLGSKDSRGISAGQMGSALPSVPLQ